MKLIINKKTKIKSVINDGDFNVEIHEDLSNKIENWYLHGLELTDYLIVKNEIKKITNNTGFINLKKFGKEYSAELCTSTPEIIISYYKSKGLSEYDAIDKYKLNRAIDIKKSCKSGYDRIESNEFAYIILKYLSESDSQIMLDEISHLIERYKNMFVLGTNYNNTINGIMDYIESTGDYIDSGLSKFNILSPFTLNEFIYNLKKILMY